MKSKLCCQQLAAVAKSEAAGRIVFLDRDTAPHRLVPEEPLSIRIQGNPYAVVMRTPGEEIAHVAGFCLAEGIVDGPGDIEQIAFCEGETTNVVTVTLNPQRRSQIAELLQRRGFLSQTSCGICGKELIQDLFQIVHPFDGGVTIDAPGIVECVQSLCAQQLMHRKTKASHAAALFDADYRLLALAEDVGRHNAVDKAVGMVFLQKELPRALILLVSSRISYELVQKAARARIPIILALSHPTALAVELSGRLNMTLVCIRDHTRINVYCGGHRIRGA